jgi:hypothetical protein
MRKDEGGDEFFVPLKKTHSGNVQENVGDVVIVTSPPRDPIRAPQRATPPRDAHVQHTSDSSSLDQRDMVEWIIGSAAR